MHNKPIQYDIPTTNELINTSQVFGHTTVPVPFNILLETYLDSLDYVELVLYIEDVTGEDISDEEADSWKTTQDIADYLNSTCPLPEQESEQATPVTLVQRITQRFSSVLSIITK